MNIVLLAGGRGTRLPATEQHLPKVLVDIAGETILARQLRHIRSLGIQNITLSLGYKAEDVVAWLKMNHENDVRYVIEKSPLGTGGGAKLAAKGFTDPFIVMNADNLGDFNFHDLHSRGNRGAHSVISGIHVSDAREYGLIEHDEEGKILSFKEKDPSLAEGIVSTGAYLLRPHDLETKEEAFSIEKDIFPRLVAKGELLIAPHKGNYWFDCGTEDRLSKVRNYFKTHEKKS